MAWLRVEAPGGERDCSLASGLERRGLTRVSDGHASGPGVVCFEDTTPAVLAIVERLAAGGRAQVVAAAVAADGLDADDTWQLVQAGASDVLVDTSEERLVDRVMARLQRWEALDELLARPVISENLIGSSTAWRTALRLVAEMAHFSDSAMLLVGPSGTGKELLARLVHTLDPRIDKGDLVVLDCTTVVPTLSGSEFFGHERGAFTGATSSREGVFALANGGTLFLDEIGELPLGLQAELLRVVQEGTYKPVGGNDWRQTQFRMVCATNRDLTEEVRRGAFRNDLYHRIASCTCRVPGLDERRSDILPLARHFLRRLLDADIDLDPAVESLLLTREYPGNVRELRQLVERMGRRHVGPGAVSVGDLSIEDLGADPPNARAQLLAMLQPAVELWLAAGLRLVDLRTIASDAAIDAALARHEGNVSRAAKALGLTARRLQQRQAERRQSPDPSLAIAH